MKRLSTSISKFEELIIKISKKENKRVVLLIDEYDNSIFSTEKKNISEHIIEIID